MRKLKNVVRRLGGRNVSDDKRDEGAPADDRPGRFAPPVSLSPRAEGDDWLARELGRLHEDVLHEPVPDDMIEILRRAEERTAIAEAEDPREAEREVRHRRALRDFLRAKPGRDTSLN